MKYIIMGLVIAISSGLGYYMYSQNNEPIVLDTSELTYIKIGEEGSNCYVKVPSTVEGDLAEMGIYKWLAACEKLYGDK